MSDDLPEVDKAYVEELIPTGTIYTGHISVLTYLTPEGEQGFRVYNQIEAPLSSTIGYLEMAKLHMAARCDGAAYLGLRGIEDD